MDIEQIKMVAEWVRDSLKYDRKQKIWVQKLNAPRWVEDVIRAAHDGGRILPDNYRYEFIAEALDYIVDEMEDPDEPPEFEADVYTADLMKWLGSRYDRTWYVDEAIRNFGKADDLDQDIMRGQIMEKEEVFHQLMEALEKAVDVAEPGKKRWFPRKQSGLGAAKRITKSQIQRLVEAYARKIFSARWNAPIRVQERFHKRFEALHDSLIQKFPAYDLTSSSFWDSLEQKASEWWESRVVKGPAADW